MKIWEVEWICKKGILVNVFIKRRIFYDSYFFSHVFWECPCRDFTLQVIKRFAFLLHNCNFVLVEREVIYGSRVTAQRGDIGILVEYEIVLLPL